MTTTRTQFTFDEIDPRHQWILQEIPDVNADAMDAACQNCLNPISWGQWLNAANYANKICCNVCGTRIFSEDCNAPLPKRFQAELTSPDYFDRTWYHATRDKDWARKVRRAKDGNLLVHAGSKISALSRADDLYSDYYDDPSNANSRSYYLHEFRLRSSKSFSRVVLEDMVDSWQTDLLEPWKMALCQVEGEQPSNRSLYLTPEGSRGVPYYNRYELPGEISILFHAQLIQLNTVKTVELTRN